MKTEERPGYLGDFSDIMDTLTTDVIDPLSTDFSTIMSSLNPGKTTVINNATPGAQPATIFSGIPQWVLYGVPIAVVAILLLKKKR